MKLKQTLVSGFVVPANTALCFIISPLQKQVSPMVTQQEASATEVYVDNQRPLSKSSPSNNEEATLEISVR